MDAQELTRLEAQLEDVQAHAQHLDGDGVGEGQGGDGSGAAAAAAERLQVGAEAESRPPQPPGGDPPGPSAPSGAPDGALNCLIGVQRLLTKSLEVRLGGGEGVPWVDGTVPELF